MTTYETGQIIGKEETDKQGKKESAKIPIWMKKDAEIPAHVKHLKCEKIELPYTDSKWVVLIRDVLTKEECDELITFSEEQGYEDALVNIGYGRQQKRPQFRNCKRMIIDSFDMAQCLWSRVHQFIPTYLDNFKKIEFNERLRFLRYHKNEYFKPHFDGTYARKNGEFSQVTFLLYLNNNFKGGTTRLLNVNDCTEFHAPEITPGMVIMFEHDVYHEGATLEEGAKYIVRTDVMYTNEMYNRKEMKEDPQNVEIKYTKYSIDEDKQTEQEQDDEKDNQQN